MSTGSDQGIAWREERIDRLVRWIRRRGLSAPAILALEASKPLAILGAQALLFCQPMLGALGPAFGGFDERQAVDQIAGLLEEPEAVERILARLERDEG